MKSIKNQHKKYQILIFDQEIMGNQCQCIDGMDKNEQYDNNTNKDVWTNQNGRKGGQDLKKSSNQFTNSSSKNQQGSRKNQSSMIKTGNEVSQITELNIPYEANKVIQSQRKRPHHRHQSQIYKIKINHMPCFYIGQVKQIDSPTGFAQVYFLNEKYQFSGYYQGQVINGQAEDQKGLYVLKDGGFYCGNVSNSKATGKGKLVGKNQSYQYIGQWKLNLPHGQGTIKNQQGTYTGQIQKGKRTGKGRFQLKDGTIYEGTFRDGVIFGKGKIHTSTEISYSGDLQHGVPNGFGEWLQEGQYYIGNFNNGKKQGQGKYKFKDGTVFQGFFKNEKPEGRGKILKNELITHGVWSDGIMIETLAIKKAPEKVSNAYFALNISRE